MYNILCIWTVFLVHLWWRCVFPINCEKLVVKWKLPEQFLVNDWSKIAELSIVYLKCPRGYDAQQINLRVASVVLDILLVIARGLKQLISQGSS